MSFVRRVEGSAENTDFDRNRSLFDVDSLMHDMGRCKEENDAFNEAHDDAVDVECHCALGKDVIVVDNSETEASVASELKNGFKEIGGLRCKPCEKNRNGKENDDCKNKRMLLENSDMRERNREIDNRQESEHHCKEFKNEMNSVCNNLFL